MNRIAQLAKRLRDRHYLLHPGRENWWFQLSLSQIEKYRDINPNFRIVFYRDENHSRDDDFYSVPYSYISDLLVEDSLYREEGKQVRWIGTIEREILKIAKASTHRDISSFHNDFTDLRASGDQQIISSAQDAGPPSETSVVTGTQLANIEKPPDPDSALAYDEQLEKLADRIEKQAIFDFESFDDARDFRLTSIVYRRGQSGFRRDLLIAYNGACSITGCRVREVLEAAHIIPYNGGETNNVKNGLLLRSDIHLLFDLFLIAIEPYTHNIRISSVLRETEYKSLDGMRATMPKSRSFSPAAEALKWRIDKLQR